jgi:sec-independent protein translocase protein TatC
MAPAMKATTVVSPETEQAQSLTDHLTELRDRLVKSIWAIALCSVAAWFFKKQIFLFLSAPIEGGLKEGSLVYTGPVDMFVVYIKIAVVTGVAASCPVWLYQIWRFVAPGLYSHEKKYSVAFIFSGTALFLIGVSFAYYLVLPTGLHFLLDLQPDPATTKIRAMIDITKYLSFLTTTALVFGLAFELPLALVLLGLMGIIDQKFLREKRRFAIVVLAAVSAVVTPPDALSMMMLLVPLYFLYELSIIVVGLLVRKPALPTTTDT